MINPLSQQYYQCVEQGDYWEISLVKKDRVDYVDTIDPDDMGDWISYEMKKAETHKVIDIRLVTWDSFLQGRYERQEEKNNE
jgi:hypothetical protein